MKTKRDAFRDQGDPMKTSLQPDCDLMRVCVRVKVNFWSQLGRNFSVDWINTKLCATPVLDEEHSCSFYTNVVHIG